MLDLLKDRLFGNEKSISYFERIKEALPPVHDAVLFDYTKDKLIEAIHTIDDLASICLSCSREQCNAIFEAMGDTIFDLVHNAADFSLLISTFYDQKDMLFNTLKKPLIASIKTLSDVLLLLETTPTIERRPLLIEIKDKLNDLFLNSRHLGSLLQHRSLSECQLVLELLKDKLVALVPTEEALNAIWRSTCPPSEVPMSKNYAFFSKFYLNQLLSLVATHRISERDELLQCFIRETSIHIEAVATQSDIIKLTKELLAVLSAVSSPAANLVKQELQSRQRQVHFFRASHPLASATALDVAFCNIPLKDRGHIFKQSENPVKHLLAEEGILRKTSFVTQGKLDTPGPQEKATKRSRPS